MTCSACGIGFFCHTALSELLCNHLPCIVHQQLNNNVYATHHIAHTKGTCQCHSDNIFNHSAMQYVVRLYFRRLVLPAIDISRCWFVCNPLIFLPMPQLISVLKR